MEWQQLYQMQSKLDQYIVETHGLEKEDLFEHKFLALLVELGELANETRCFKFWSKKKQINESAVLEEYVDNIHFILSLGLEKGFYFEGRQIQNNVSSLTEKFNEVFQACFQFQSSVTKESYDVLFASYLGLGQLLGFSETAIQAAYYDKNQVNFKRQDDGY